MGKNQTSIGKKLRVCAEIVKLSIKSKIAAQHWADF